MEESIFFHEKCFVAIFFFFVSAMNLSHNSSMFASFLLAEVWDIGLLTLKLVNLISVKAALNYA